MDIDTLLRERFGFDQFRPGQREAIETLLAQRRLLCIQPTGHGKSLLYQLPALLLDGVTLVISPLLALMRDQIGQLQQRFSITAASINSEQSEEDNAAVRQRVQAGEVKLLFVSPEQIARVQSEAFFLGLPVALVVIDEAHCVSTWGHDFRPAYREIVHFVGRLQAPRVLALTATANGRVEEDIVMQLGEAVVVQRQSSDRTNLALASIPRHGMAEKLAYLDALLPKVTGSVLIYCATRARVQTVSAFLVARGMSAAGYHAGLEPHEKQALQRDFIANGYRIFVATNALGMGVDKPDVRCVIHFDMPGSITAYYQEVGRAGRDGGKAAGRLLFDPGDQRIHQHFIKTSQPSGEDFSTVLAALQAPLGEMALRSKTGLHPTLLRVVLAALNEQGFVQKRAEKNKQLYERVQSGTPDLTQFTRQALARQKELDAMVAYASGADCLMATLRNALGDSEVTVCGRCQRCLKQTSAIVTTPEQVSAAEDWLRTRSTPIAGAVRLKLSEGLSLLDQDTAPALIQTLLESRRTDAIPQLQDRLLAALPRPFDAVVVLPSRGWVDRIAFAQALAQRLGVPVHTDVLRFSAAPAATQSELSNNDQRRDNVKGTMVAQGHTQLGKRILLLDDVIGSGATMHEAVRTLRKGYDGEIVPITLARVQWAN